MTKRAVRPRQHADAQQMRRSALSGVILATLGAIMIALSVTGPAGSARAQRSNRAGLVVQYGDGSVSTTCVTFSESSISGLELLKRSGLDINVDYSGGAMICKIGPDGCTSPQENCTCKFPSEQKYWNYWLLSDGAWRYSQAGAGTSVVADGAIQGWRWGTASDSASATTTMPIRSIDQICTANVPPIAIAASATATTNPTSTATQAPSSTPLPSATATALSIALVPIAETATALPTAQSTPTVPGATATAAVATPVNATQTPTAAAIAQNAATQTPPAAATVVPTNIASVTSATPTAEPTATPAQPTATSPAASATPQAIAAARTAAPEAIVVAAQPAEPAPIAGLPTAAAQPKPTSVAAATSGAQTNVAGYVVFATLAAGLLGAITFLKARR